MMDDKRDITCRGMIVSINNDWMKECASLVTVMFEWKERKCRDTMRELAVARLKSGRTKGDASFLHSAPSEQVPQPTSCAPSNASLRCISIALALRRHMHKRLRHRRRPVRVYV